MGRHIGFMDGAAIALFDDQRGQHSPCHHVRERGNHAGIDLGGVDAVGQRFDKGGEGFAAAGQVGDGQAVDKHHQRTGRTGGAAGGLAVGVVALRPGQGRTVRIGRIAGGKDISLGLGSARGPAGHVRGIGQPA